MHKRIGFCCQWYHHDQTLKAKQLEEIGCSIEKQFDENSKGEIIESGISLNWAIIKHLNR